MQRCGEDAAGIQVKELLLETPVVAAVKDQEDLEKCLQCGAKVVFILYGDLLNIGGTVARIRQAGKLAIVHIDLVDGLSSREVSVDFIAQNTHADGIISTRPALIRYAHAKGLITVQRFFLLDSLALVNIHKQVQGDAADLIEILPCVMPRVIHRLVTQMPKPVIVGGLISEKEDVISALGAGAIAVSSSNAAVWDL